MNTRRLHLAAGLAALALAAAGTAAAAPTGTHADIGRILFRLKENVVICALGRPNTAILLCFRPDTGVTVRLAPRGRATVRVVRDNRGVPTRARKAPLLRAGHVFRESVFQCSLRRTEVRCRSKSDHGFQMGKVAVYRF